MATWLTWSVGHTAADQHDLQPVISVLGTATFLDANIGGAAAASVASYSAPHSRDGLRDSGARQLWAEQGNGEVAGTVLATPAANNEPPPPVVDERSREHLFPKLLGTEPVVHHAGMLELEQIMNKDGCAAMDAAAFRTPPSGAGAPSTAQPVVVDRLPRRSTRPCQPERPPCRPRP